MRRGRDAGILLSESGELVGFDLGVDFAAEHEWGIAGIRQHFGLCPPDACLGLAGRKITQLPAGKMRLVNVPARESYFRKHGAKKLKLPDELALLFNTYFDETGYLGEVGGLPSFDELDGSAQVRAAWDDRSFGIIVSHEQTEYLREMWAAFQRLDVAVWVGAGHVFKNGGLKIVIASRIPAEAIAKMESCDSDAAELKAAADSTGVEGRLKEAGKDFFALNPRWRSDVGKSSSAYPVIFWLNPVEQGRNNFGWFTVEELDAWARGEGPILKNEVR